ncbi:hypothetical protein AGR7B_Lc50199 [Agrobacterium deltaense RV3]|nr:hypothetical protein AGR7B_Lc50199 [Agrobacterium deltaense RV3]
MPVEHDKVVDAVHDGVTGKIERADRIHDNIEPVERGGQGCCHFAFVFNKQQAHEFISVLSGVPSGKGRGERQKTTAPLTLQTSEASPSNGCRHAKRGPGMVDGQPRIPAKLYLSCHARIA